MRDDGQVTYIHSRESQQSSTLAAAASIHGTGGRVHAQPAKHTRRRVYIHTTYGVNTLCVIDDTSVVYNSMMVMYVDVNAFARN